MLKIFLRSMEIFWNKGVSSAHYTWTSPIWKCTPTSWSKTAYPSWARTITSNHLLLRKRTPTGTPVTKAGWRTTGRTSTNSVMQFKAFSSSSRKFHLTLFSIFHCSISLCMPAVWLQPGPGGASYYKRSFLCYSWFDLKQNVLEILEEHLAPSSIQPKLPRPTSSG